MTIFRWNWKQNSEIEQIFFSSLEYFVDSGNLQSHVEKKLQNNSIKTLWF